MIGIRRGSGLLQLLQLLRRRFGPGLSDVFNEVTEKISRLACSNWSRSGVLRSRFPLSLSLLFSVRDLSNLRELRCSVRDGSWGLERRHATELCKFRFNGIDSL